MTETVARRTALKYLGLLTTTALGRDFLSAWLPSAPAQAQSPASRVHTTLHGTQNPTGPVTPYVPQFFKPEEFETIGTLTEMIIPTDEQPGAREARVSEYIDFVVFSAAEFKPSLQSEWTRGLAELDRSSRTKYGRRFSELAMEQREQLLTEMSLPERDPKARHRGFAFFRLVKEMTVEGFYTSRVGLIEVLGYKGLAYLSEFPGCTHPEHQS
jgi:hypothetical protein